MSSSARPSLTSQSGSSPLRIVLVAVLVLMIGGFAAPAADAAATAAGAFFADQLRVVDTNTGTGGLNGPLPASTWITIDVAGIANLPTVTTTAVELNFNALSPTAKGYVKAVANDVTTTNVSVLDYAPAEHVTNSAVVALSSDGKIKVWTSVSTGVGD